MTKREKYQYTYEAIEAEIVRLERRLADRIANNVHSLTDLKLNNVDVILEVGRLKALREIFFK